MAAPRGVIDKCKSCQRRLLVSPQTGLCLSCENDALKERVILLEFQLSQCTKQNAELLQRQRKDEDK